MALTITDAETERLARELAAVTGETITEALRLAVEDRLVQVGQDTLAELVRRGRARSTLDDRTSEEIVGYGPEGLPA